MMYVFWFMLGLTLFHLSSQALIAVEDVDMGLQVLFGGTTAIALLFAFDRGLVLYQKAVDIEKSLSGNIGG
jgi:hypothetical protein